MFTHSTIPEDKWGTTRSLGHVLFSWFNQFRLFLVIFRSSVNGLVFDWLIKKYETFSLVRSWCLRNKVKLESYLQSLSRDVTRTLLVALSLACLEIQ